MPDMSETPLTPDRALVAASSPVADRIRTALRSRTDELRGMVVLGAQLAVLLLVIQALRIESPAFYDRVVPLAFGGAVVHHFLSERWRSWFFIALSLTGFALVFGLEGAAWVVVLGVTVIAWVHTPIPFWYRVGGWLALVVGLGVVRAGVVPAPFDGHIWPVFGSIFMLRMIVYLYDLRHQKGPTNWRMALSYFFMLPSVVFPFFPIIDYATFRRTWYDKPALATYQTGVHWIVRGVTHLVVYRLVYQYFTLAPAEISSGTQLVQYLLANFALYLRVSGQFHVIVGLLHLFGFRLPETHRFFYLAASFTDFWRRINIYWKDFMQKVFFMPVFFPLMKKQGEVIAIIAATSVTILATWFLHSYQWFWLLGRWLFTPTDMLFWVILGVLLVLDSLRERRTGRVRPGSARTRTLGYQVSLGVRAAAIFTVMCVIWAFWNAPNLAEAVNLFRVPSWSWTATLAVLAVWLIIAVSAGISERIRPPGHEDVVPPTAWLTLKTAIPVLALWASDASMVRGKLPAAVRHVSRDLRVPELNARDAAQLQRGYYEELVGVNRFNGELWNVYVQKGKDWPRLEELGGLRFTNDMRRVELEPFLGIMFHGHPFRTNRWGMRDRYYPPLPAPGTHRVAVLGPSYVMGDGVPDGATFEALVEARLNRERPLPGAERWEFLNFAVSEYSPLSNLAILENGRVSGFKPHTILVTGHGIDLYTTDHVAYAVRRRIPLQWDFVQRVVDSVQATPDLPREELIRRLKPFEGEIVTEAYRRIAAAARGMGARLAWVHVPTPMQRHTPDDEERLRQLALSAGLDVIDLRTVYRDADQRDLIVAEWDRHPNTEGHKLIADALYRELVARPDLITLSPSSWTPSSNPSGRSSSIDSSRAPTRRN
jgi:D-alanyl-lipoteichoic acid acyltransferase DltB (MBOAT superfamily)